MVRRTPQLPVSLAERLQQARARTDAMFRLLAPGALYERPIPERHRNIFYLGHIEAFDWNQLCRAGLGASSFHPSFDKLFEFGIDPPVGRPAEDRPSDWPAVEEVLAYNSRVRDAVDDAILRAPEQLVQVAIEHREMHAETFAYMLHNLPLKHKLAPDDAAPILTGRHSPERRAVEIPAGEAVLGRPRGDGFGWDNEFEQLRLPVAAFSIDRDKVTNGQFLEFVGQGAPAPRFWTRREGGWALRTMFGEVPLPLDWPVWVTHDQACAYAEWRRASLPTEAQFHRAAYGTPDGGERDPDSAAANCNFLHWDPTPVGAGNSLSPFGVSEMIGNGWEWTSTLFAPFEGFAPFPFYPGYSANFFDGQHYVMKGASPRTAGCFLRRSFRNWFRPNYPYVFAGFRCV